MVKDGKTNLSEKRLDDISKQLTKMDANLNQNLEQMNEYLKYISYAALIWIVLIVITLLIFVLMVGVLNASPDTVDIDTTG
mgnify:CR=1 FL=1